MKKSVLISLALFMQLIIGNSYGIDFNTKYDIRPSKEYFEKMKQCDKQNPPSLIRIRYLDLGPRLHVNGRPAVWKSQELYLGETCYIALVGPHIYQDEKDNEPDYYTIEVHMKIRTKSTEGGSTVGYTPLFHRSYRIEHIPEELMITRIENIVKYDNNTRTVSFMIGDKVEKYVLPEP